MKSLFTSLCTLCVFLTATAQQTLSNQADPNKSIQVVPVACGECKFGMKGNSCDLAVKMNGRPMFVDGTKLDDHGDSHAKDGLCNAVRYANVQGEIVNNRFKATYFKLIPPASASRTRKK